jgi:iron(III) transport system substrate-binding protein
MTNVPFLILAASCWAGISVACAADGQKPWDDIVAAARTEGKVVVMNSPDPVMKNEIIPRFREKFGIQVEAIFGDTGTLAERAKLERSSGISTVDVFMVGVGTALFTLEPAKMLAPVKPLLALADVTDGAKWKSGQLKFLDSSESILVLFNNVDSFLIVNEDYVKPGELKEARDLLNPKWKGKISTQDPFSSGTGSDIAAYYYKELGPEFVKRLYVDQQPILQKDRRQLMDMLARGVAPICLTCKIENATELLKDGFKIREIFSLGNLKQRVTSSPFVLAYADGAPHPKAAQVFINWIASKEALEIYSRGNRTVTLRNDIDESFLDPNVIPKAGAAYFHASEGEWMLTGRREATQKARAVIKGTGHP